jgi:hypothetical protein
MQIKPLDSGSEKRDQKFEYISDGTDTYYLQIAQRGQIKPGKTNGTKRDKLVNLATGVSMMRDTANRSFERLTRVFRNYVYEFKKVASKNDAWFLIRTDVRNPDITFHYKLPLKDIKGVYTTQCVVQHDRFCLVLAYEFTEKNLYMLKVDLKLNMDENNINGIPPKVEILKKFNCPDKSDMLDCNRVAISRDLQQVAAVYKIIGQDNRRLEIFDISSDKVLVYKDSF